jgi:hypothetical protein
MPTVFKCKSCGQEHRPPNALDFTTRGLLAAMVIRDVECECPTTGERRAYSSPDFVWRDEEPAAEAR